MRHGIIVYCTWGFKYDQKLHKWELQSVKITTMVDDVLKWIPVLRTAY